MKQFGRALPALLAPLILSASQPQQACPAGGIALVSPRLGESAYRKAAADAELVAPAAAAATSRHRGSSPPGSSPAGTPPVVNFIDSDLFAAASAAGVRVTALSTDAEFLRRVSLDLTGQIPDAATVAAFLADTRADKRAKKIDELLATDAFNDRWTMWFGDLVQNVQVSTNAREYYLGRNAYHDFIRDSIASSKPYDQLVREAILTDGTSFTTGAANFTVRQLQPNGPIQDTYDNLAASSGEKFLGMPLLCLSCHSGIGHLELVNQSLRVKSRADFWGMAAFFAKVRISGSKYTDPNNPNANLTQFTIAENPNGQYQLNTNSGNKTPRVPPSGSPGYASPVYMFTGETPRPGENPRVAFGRILTADRQFARATVNYLWKEMFGIGIVEPTNAFDLARLDPNHLPDGQTLQPTNPKLLEDLTDAFIASGYDLRSILRTMATSSSYQLSSYYTPATWNEGWTTLFVRHYPHRLMAEMVWDAVTKATGVTANINVNGAGTVTRAMQLPDTTEPGPGSQLGTFLNDFGRGDRDETKRSSDSSISQALSMLNSPLVTTRVKRNTANSTVGKILAATTDPSAIADQLYVATLSRHPSASELASAVAYLKGGTLSQRSEDLQFALLNQLEFLFD